MRFAHVVPDGADRPQLVIVDGDRAAIVGDMFAGAPSRLQQLIEGGDALLDRVREESSAAPWRTFGSPEFASAVLGHPVTIAVGLNYAAHSSELGLKADAAPTIFTLWPGSLSGHRRTTSWPRTLSQSVDYEAELGVIVGPAARDVALENALDHVWGYTVVNDITARDIQFSEAQWSRCKSFDGFTPTGPFVVTADEVPDPQDLHIWAVVDGQTVQDASTGQMIHPVAKLVSYLSRSATLLPGTLISTGSPGGAGYSRDPQIFLRDRSTVTVGIDGIGELTTFCRITD